MNSLPLNIAIVVALTRLLALSHSMWDWDEALFSMALHDYDVTQHHPHPPGFPTFIFLAKIVRLFVQRSNWNRFPDLRRCRRLLRPWLWLNRNCF